MKTKSSISRVINLSARPTWPGSHIKQLQKCDQKSWWWDRSELYIRCRHKRESESERNRSYPPKNGLSYLIIIIIIIPPLTIVSDDQWGDLECLYKAWQAASTDWGLVTDTGVDERCENERQSENDCETKTLARSRAREPTRVGANKTKEERIVQTEMFWV